MKSGLEYKIWKIEWRNMSSSTGWQTSVVKFAVGLSDEEWHHAGAVNAGGVVSQI